MSAEHFFPMIDLLPERLGQKPRDRGKTMLVDMGIPAGQLLDLLDLTKDYIDYGKLAFGSPALYPKQVLSEKLAIYKNADIRVFLGGQFLEFVLYKSGWSHVSTFVNEARALGIDAVEISDNLVPISMSDKLKLVAMILDGGLGVHGEVGSKDDKGDPSELIDQAHAFISAGCTDVLFEAAEMVDEAGQPIHQLIETIGKSDVHDKAMYELPGPWIKGVGPSGVYEMMKLMVSVFGPNANIGNVWHDQVFILECMRHGLSASGPLEIMNQSALRATD